jgi:hypothetical protein
MGEVIPMDSLSRGTKPEGNKAGKPGQGAPGGTGDKLGNFGNKIGSSMPNMPKKHQKALQKKLGQLQKAAPEIGKKLAGGVFGQMSLAKDFLKQIDFERDWIFILVASFALLKDIFDIALAAIPGVGVVVSFIMAIMLLMLTVVALLLTGSDLKNRALGKYILTMSLGFIAEALPAIGWLPIAFIETLLIYGLTLFDRMMLSYDQKNEDKEAGGQKAQSQYPDNYPMAEPEQKAA